jgi:hypothetical protein
VGYNLLHATTAGPRCGTTGSVEIEFTFGLLGFRDYALGDAIERGVKGLRNPGQRPRGGNYEGEGYVECQVCGSDEWVWITVLDDVITDVPVDKGRPGHVPDDGAGGEGS